MTEPLTSRMIKDAVRKLEQAQAAYTRRCPECGGEPWGEHEWTRLCTACGNYLVRVGIPELYPDPVHVAMMQALDDD